MKKFLLGLFVALGVLFSSAKPALALETPYLSAKYLGGDRVMLWWNEVPNATYQVYYGPKENPMAHGVTLGTGTNYTVQALFRNTSYVFAVKALRGDDVSSMSQWVWVKTGGYGRPAVAQQPVVYNQPTYTPPQPAAMPATLWAKHMGNGNVALWWTQVPGATYHVYYGPKENPMAHGVALGEGTSYTVGALFRNTTYGFMVKAVRGNEPAIMTNWVWVTTDGTGRAAVTYYAPQPMMYGTAYAPTMQNLSLGTRYVGGDSVQLWWSDVPGAWYELHYGPVGDGHKYQVALGMGTSYTVSQLYRNTSFVFEVIAHRDGMTWSSNWTKAWVGPYGRPADAYPMRSY